MAKPKIKSDGRTITVRVPISIRKRGGKKIVLAPNGIEHDPSKLRCRQVDNAMVKALARAFRWREMLERGEYPTIKVISVAEKINDSYVARLLRLTLLAPTIVESILDNRTNPELTLPRLLRPFPPIWRDQRTLMERVAR
jgi:hypothetical protein